MENTNRIPSVFKGQHIFLSGGSGFMGKVFIERLLRETKIGKIYLLLRNKGGNDPMNRLKILFDDPIFEMLKEQISMEMIFSKVTVVIGDCEKLNLGLSDKDRQLIIENIAQIYNFAAIVRFDQQMKKSILTNTRGTREMIKLALECKRLKLFGHMSTAFCHVHVPTLLEKPYDPLIDPHKIIDMMENLSDEEIERNSVEILRKHKLPNTYAFSKSLSEALVVEARNNCNLPVLIFRPSNVIASLNDPFPGYTDNLNGPMWVSYAVGKGIIHSMYCDQKSNADLIPVDVAIKLIFVCVWNFYEFKNKDHFIINLTRSHEIYLTLEDFASRVLKILRNEYPFNNALWHPNVSLTKYLWIHNIRNFFYHWLRAWIIDLFVQIFGYKPFLRNITKRTSNAAKLIEYYITRKWIFDATIQVLFKKRLNKRENGIYVENSNDIGLECTILGLRRHIDKTPDNTLKAAISLRKKLFMLDVIVKILIYGGLCSWLFFLVPSLFTVVEISSVLKFLFCIFSLFLFF